MEDSTHNENDDTIVCIICDKLGSGSGCSTDLGDVIKITRGVATLRAASNERQDGLIRFLESQFVYAHAICRQKYINKKYIEIQKKQAKEDSAQSPPKKKLRSSISINFDWEKNCLICGILELYSAPIKVQDLNKLRFNSFLKGTAKKIGVQLASLPPTSDAAFEHLKRVYLQVQIWLGNNISVENWGWRYVSDKLEPILMKQSPAPDNLLKMLFCNCKKGCGNACGCRKIGLYCTSECSQCNGDSGFNASPVLKISEVEVSDENGIIEV